MRIMPVQSDRNQNKSSVTTIPFGQWNYLKQSGKWEFTQAQHDLIDAAVILVKKQLLNREEKMMTEFYPGFADGVSMSTTIEGVNVNSPSFFRDGDDVVAKIEKSLNELLAISRKSPVKLSKTES